MFISLDLETTGTDPSKDKIIEFGAVKFDLNGNRETLQTLLNPGISIPNIITHITNLRDEDVKDAPTIRDKYDEIREFIGDCPIIGHNIQFDTGFLRGIGMELNNEEIDTYHLANLILPKCPSYSLEVLSSLLNLAHQEKHRALDDSIAAMELFLKLTNIYQNLPLKTFERINAALNKSNWALKDTLLSLGHIGNTQEALNFQEIKKTNVDEEDTQKAKQILGFDFANLIETLPPYNNLIQALATENKEAIIAIPQEDFLSLYEELPENVRKIDSPKSYISIEKVEKLEAKDFLEDHEVTALIKYLIWLDTTKTGLIREVHLNGKEKVTISEVTGGINNKELEKESKCTICTHDYLIEKHTVDKKVIVMDFEKFMRKFYFDACIELKINHFGEESSSKIVMIFGLIGILFEKFNDQNPYSPRATVNEEIIASREWEQIKDSVSTLEDSENEFINRKIQDLKTFFNEPDTTNYMLFLEKNYFGDEILLKKNPYSLKKELESQTAKWSTYHLIGENFDLNDNGDFIKNLYGLDPLLPVINLSNKQENLDIFVVEDLPTNDFQPPEVKNAFYKMLIDFVETTKGKTAIVFSSKANMTEATIRMDRMLKSKTLLSQTTCNTGKLKTKLKQAGEDCVVLITPNTWEQLEDYEDIDTVIIHKIPFSPPSDPYIIARSRNFTDPFSQLQIPDATITLKKILNRLSGPNTSKTKTAVILDSRLVQKSYGKPIMESLKSIAEPTVIQSTSLGNLCQSD